MNFVISGIPVSSKNEYGIANGKMFLRSDIKKYYASAERELRIQARQYNYNFPMSDDVHCMFIFYVPDWRRDFINLLGAPADALQKAEIIKNDRQIKCVDGSRIASIDKNNPRTEITISILKEV